MSREIVYMTVIAGRKEKSLLISELTGFGAALLTVVYGKGLAEYSSFLQALGLYHQHDKEVITCLIKEEKVDEVFEMLRVKFKFDKPDTGIAFTVKVEGVLY